MSYLKKNYKKEINYYKIKKLLNQYPFLFFYHFNNLTTQEKIDLKKKLSKIEKTDLLVVKNKVADRMIKTDHITNKSQIYNDLSLQIKKAEKIQIQDLQAEAAFLGKAEERSLIKKIPNDILYKLSPFFKGPTLLIGFSSLNHFQESAKVLTEYPNLVFIVGFYENIVVNHLDYNLLLNLDKSIQLKLIYSLYSPLLFYPLFSNISKLLLLLTEYCKSKKL